VRLDKVGGDLQAVHLIGVGGAGMSALARLFFSRGVIVSGSDLKESRHLAALRVMGADIRVGHDSDNLLAPDVVVVSSAIPEANPELLEARRRGIPVLRRAEALALLMKQRRGLAVAGTHGKTTTTSLLVLILQEAGLDPSFAVGADLNEAGTNAYDGSGEFFVAEADESDGSFLCLAPEGALVTNVEADHLDFYRDLSEVEAAFHRFVELVPVDGVAVLCHDDAGAAGLAGSVTGRVVTYGIDPAQSGGGVDGRADVAAAHIEVLPYGSRFDLVAWGERLGRVEIRVPGRHYVKNSVGAAAMALSLGLSFDAVAAGVGRYTGVARRFQPRGSAGGVSLVDDYAHHPTEVAATLSAAQTAHYRRVFAVLQPHRYSRTRALGLQMGASLVGADLVVVTDVYGAGEAPIPGITGKRVVEGLLDVRPDAQVAYLPHLAEAADFVARRARPGDLVVTMGAGDVTLLPDLVLERLAERFGLCLLEEAGR